MHSASLISFHLAATHQEYTNTASAVAIYSTNNKKQGSFTKGNTLFKLALVSHISYSLM